MSEWISGLVKPVLGLAVSLAFVLGVFSFFGIFVMIANDGENLGAITLFTVQCFLFSFLTAMSLRIFELLERISQATEKNAILLADMNNREKRDSGEPSAYQAAVADMAAEKE